MRRPSRFSEVGFESMKMSVFCCLDAQNGLTFTGTARRRFSPLSAGSSVLDALWIVAIILEQPAYALIVPQANPLLVAHFVAPGVNVNLELSRSGNGVRNGFRRPDGR